MNNKDILFALHETPGIGWRTILNLVSKCENLTQILDMDAADIIALEVIANKVDLIHQACEPSFIDMRRDLYEQEGAHIISFYDEEYPELLRQSGEPPWIIYVKGNIKLWKSPMIGMVGTRIPTTYGKRVASQLAREISESGICVVSGLARGIDSEAHLGALTAKGKTIAILGTALNEAYPRENEKLMDRIADEGAVISEYPLGTLSHPGLFPLRNRIIAGIGSGVIVVEADIKSGSLITASQAIADNREVYAVPGPISSPKSRGTHKLIKDGSNILTCAEDLINDFREKKLVQADNSRFLAPITQSSEITEEELHLLQFMSDEPIHIDLLIERSGFDFGHFHSVLISLLMKKKIEQQFGSSYILLY
jgi:DNA processing protein